MMKLSRNMLIGLAVLGLVALYLIFNYTKVVQGFTGSMDGPTFTMYYVDWCGHCKAAKPIFTDFMGSGTVNVNGKSVKCNMVNPENNPEATKDLKIKGFPTFILHNNGENVEFSGPRTADGFNEFLSANL
jgi:thiol-disulfide isomerase/thioredoxin